MPIKLQRLRLRNDSARHRTLSVTYYVEWTLGENRESTQMHVVTTWDDEAQALLARNRYHPEYGDRVAFAAISPACGVIQRRPHDLPGAQSLAGKPCGDGADQAFTADGGGMGSLCGAAGQG